MFVPSGGPHAFINPGPALARPGQSAVIDLRGWHDIEHLTR
jgi:hypothetical protein